MGEFGWAYISGSATGGAAAGVTNSIQVKYGVANTTGSHDFTFNRSTKKVELTGSFNVEGHISASSISLYNTPAGAAATNRFLALDAGNNVVTTSSAGGGGGSVTISNDGDNRIVTAKGDGTINGEQNFTFDGSQLIVSGTLIVSGSIFARDYSIDITNKNITNISVTGSTVFGDSSGDLHQFTGSLSVTQNVSASAYFGDGSNLSGITTNPTLNEVVGNGNVTTGSISVGPITGSTMKITGLASGTGVASKYLVLDSGNNVVLTSSTGGGGGGGSSTIGNAEDGSYADGLFADFASSTPIGTAVDKFNEVLKILAPSPAPNLSLINADSRNGVSAKLSFDASNAVTGHSASATAAGFSAVARNSAYQVSSSNNNLRLGVYASHDITGALNFNTAPNVTNNYMAYSSGAFGNAETGSLQLELNGAVVHTLNLSSFTGAGNPATGSASSLTNDCGFVSVSVSASSYDGNNAEWYIFKHRTAKYKVASTFQRKGWNYARVLHVIGATTYSTNYVEWLTDPEGSGVALTATNPRIENIILRGSKYLSGVQYNTGSNANYKVELNNMYRNVYPSNSNTITFTVTNSSTPAAQSVPAIGGGQDNTKIISVTGALAVNVSSLLSASLTANVSATHPLKANLSNAGSTTTTNGFLIDNRTLASSNLVENFHDESYRITSASYDTQNSVTVDAAGWNSETHMTGSNVDGHQDGLLFYNQRLYSPVDNDIPNGGNFSTLLNVQSGQPNYSSVVGTRTFYRVLTNSSGVNTSNFKIVTTKNSTTFNNSTLGASNAHFFFKIPGTTGWMDITQNFSYGQISDGNGALVAGASNDVDSGNNIHHLTIGTASLNNGSLAVIKILADESWGGYLSQLEFFLSASTNTPVSSEALDNIDSDSTGKGARLSFGSSNVINVYSSATGSGLGSMSTFNTNGTYTATGNRKGVFTSSPTLTGTLNEDVNASGSNYTNNSFKNAFQGALILEVNGSEVHETSLINLEGITNSFNGNSSGFTVSPVFYGESNNIPFYDKTYRTGSYQVGANDQNVGWNYARVVHNLDKTPMQTIIVTVVGGIFYFDGVKDTTLSLKIGNTYRFDTSHSSNSSHPLAFSTTSGGSHNGGSAYTTGVTSGANYIQIIPEAAVTLYPYCTSHPNMGGSTQLNITAATKTQTNYVEWIVDPSGSVEDTAVSGEVLSNFGHTTKYYQSGIGYFASRPTGSYSYLASNFYRNVYATGSSAIDFPTTTRCSITNVRMSGSGVTTTNSASATSGMAILNNSTNCHLTTLQVTGTVLFDASPSVSISGGLGQFTSYGVTVNSTIRHPFKNDKTATSLSKNYFMIYSGSVGSTNENTLEYFGMESYRIVSGNYSTQTEATQSASKWNPATAMNNGGTHDDGMVTSNGHLISPFQIGNKGDTRSANDGGSLQAPDSNPNYSTLTNSTRTYYRYFKNNTGNDRSSITITLHGSGSMVEKSTSLGNNGNFHLEAKVPESTAWLDAGKSYISNNKDTDGSGALVGGSSPTPISTGGTSFSITFNGGSQLGTGGGSKAVVLKISAHKDWIGYLERITVAYS